MVACAGASATQGQASERVRARRGGRDLGVHRRASGRPIERDKMRTRRRPRALRWDRHKTPGCALPPLGHKTYLAEPMWIAGRTDAEVARALDLSREGAARLWRVWSRAIARHARKAPLPAQAQP